jgi:hypothetical protein
MIVSKNRAKKIRIFIVQVITLKTIIVNILAWNKIIKERT